MVQLDKLGPLGKASGWSKQIMDALGQGLAEP